MYLCTSSLLRENSVFCLWDLSLGLCLGLLWRVSRGGSRSEDTCGTVSWLLSGIRTYSRNTSDREPAKYIRLKSKTQNKKKISKPTFSLFTACVLVGNWQCCWCCCCCWTPQVLLLLRFAQPRIHNTCRPSSTINTPTLQQQQQF